MCAQRGSFIWGTGGLHLFFSASLKIVQCVAELARLSPSTLMELIPFLVEAHNSFVLRRNRKSGPFFFAFFGSPQSILWLEKIVPKKKIQLEF